MSGVFFTCMKLAIYRFGLFLFITVLLPGALPGGPHDVTSAVLRRNEPLTADSDNQVPQAKSQEQDQAQRQEQRQEQQQGAQAVIRFIRNPDPAPEFAVRGIDGSTVNLAGTRGKVVLLNFWATWCGPCRMEIPDLVELQKKYQDRLQVIGLVVDDEDGDTVRKFAKRYGINYPVAMATEDMRIEFGGVPALPTSFIIDVQGRVVQKHIGLRDPALYELEVRALLGLPINARVETFEDTGEVFLKHANRASELPGVDMTSLTPAQKTVALHRMNEETCTCGCQYTLAQCRIYDSACHVSRDRGVKIVAECANGPSGHNPNTAPARSVPPVFQP
jgi:thiol-disulfide isomerase/thioredoxin